MLRRLGTHFYARYSNRRQKIKSRVEERSTNENEKTRWNYTILFFRNCVYMLYDDDDDERSCSFHLFFFLAVCCVRCLCVQKKLSFHCLPLGGWRGLVTNYVRAKFIEPRIDVLIKLVLSAANRITSSTKFNVHLPLCTATMCLLILAHMKKKPSQQFPSSVWHEKVTS